MSLGDIVQGTSYQLARNLCYSTAYPPLRLAVAAQSAVTDTQLDQQSTQNIEQLWTFWKWTRSHRVVLENRISFGHTLACRAEHPD